MTPRALLGAAALAALACALGARGIDSDIYEGGEAREGLVVREMLDTRDGILPLWNGNVVPSKPPLFHWLAAGAATVAGTGVTERTLRAPSVLLAGAVVLLVVLAALRWEGLEGAALAGLVLATTPAFLAEAGDGRVDMTLCAAITAAQLAVVHALEGTRGARLLLAVALGLAMLAKGPVGPGLVGLTALVFAARERRLRPILGLVRPLPVIVFLAIVGSWYALAYQHRGWDFVAKQVISENGEALLGGERFPYRSPLYYVGPLLVGGLPWTLVLPWAVAHGWRGNLLRRYAVVWAATVWIFFSLAPLKRAAYLLPLRPALALLIGGWLAEAAREARAAGRLVPVARAAAFAACVLGVGVAVLAVVVAHGGLAGDSLRDRAARYEIDVETYRRTITARELEIALVSGAGAIAAAIAARALGRERWRNAAVATAAVVASSTLLVRDIFVPARAAQKSVAPFAREVRDRLGPASPLALLTGEEEIPFIFYVGRHVPVLGGGGRHPPPVEPGYYVVDQARWEGWDSPAGWEEVLRSRHLFSTHRRDLVLVRRR